MCMCMGVYLGEMEFAYHKKQKQKTKKIKQYKYDASFDDATISIAKRVGWVGARVGAIIGEIVGSVDKGS